MKRSEINKIIKDMENFLKEHCFEIPPFCKWSPEEWQEKGSEYDEIRRNQLGWDITDCGLGKFEEIGFSLITLRNGNLKDPDNKKTYAEKIIMLKENQSFPFHFHWHKTEDIINRGGGDLIITVYNDQDGSFSEEDVLIHSDGHQYYVQAGTKVVLKPGESITLLPHQYHAFSVVKGSGDVLIGEVSMCNDDDNDNRFYEHVGRFPEIIEDEAPYKLLCKEYPSAP